MPASVRKRMKCSSNDQIQQRPLASLRLSKNRKRRRSAKIGVCDDVWFDVFRFIGLVQLGLQIATLSARFDALMDKHFKVIKWSLGRLVIRHNEDGTGAQLAKPGHPQKEMEFAESPLPSGVVGFNSIRISYVDQNAMAFLHRIQRLFNTTDIAFRCDGFGKVRGLSLRNIWHLFSGNIAKLDVDIDQLTQFIRHLSPTVLCECANLRSIYSYNAFPDVSDDSGASPADHALSKWLHTPRANGRPKMFSFKSGVEVKHEHRKMEQFKKTFIDAVTPVSYIIRLLHRWSGAFEPFELHNSMTQERLTLRYVGVHAKWLLERSPIGRDEQKWSELANEPNDLDLWEEEESNMISVDFNVLWPSPWPFF
uniref:F-box protein n=1 Tax=Globodera rostochiensis TaxID=31243 RepID=A0A914HHX3_GLORO